MMNKHIKLGVIFTLLLTLSCAFAKFEVKIKPEKYPGIEKNVEFEIDFSWGKNDGVRTIIITFPPCEIDQTNCKKYYTDIEITSENFSYALKRSGCRYVSSEDDEYYGKILCKIIQGPTTPKSLTLTFGAKNLSEVTGKTAMRKYEYWRIRVIEPSNTEDYSKLVTIEWPEVCLLYTSPSPRD